MTSPCDFIYEASAIDRIRDILLAGGVAVYPTETYYAVGCVPTCLEAVSEITRLKRRDADKPLSLLAGSRVIAGLAADISQAPPALMEKYWPGPLTLVLPARPGLAPQAVDANGKTAIRISSHPLAGELSRLCGSALVATSANISGGRAAGRLRQLDRELVAELAKSPLPHGIMGADFEYAGVGAPSTIVEPIPVGGNQWRLRLIREGAIDKKCLDRENYQLAL